MSNEAPLTPDEEAEFQRLDAQKQAAATSDDPLSPQEEAEFQQLEAARPKFKTYSKSQLKAINESATGPTTEASTGQLSFEPTPASGRAPAEERAAPATDDSSVSDITGAIKSALIPEEKQHLPYDPKDVIDKYKDMGDFMLMPSIRKEFLNSPLAALGMIGSDADSFEKIVKKNYPDIKIKHDEDGSLVMSDPADKLKDYAFKKGSFQTGDAIRMLMGGGVAAGVGAAGTLGLGAATIAAPEAVLGALMSTPAWLAGVGGAAANQHLLGWFRQHAGGAPTSLWEDAGAALMHTGMAKAGKWWRGPQPGVQTPEQLAENVVAGGRGNSAAADAAMSQMQPSQPVVAAADRLGVTDQLTPGQVSTNPTFKAMTQTALGSGTAGADLTHAESLKRVAHAFESGIQEGGGPGSQDAMEAIRKNITDSVDASRDNVQRLYKPETIGVSKQAPIEVSNLTAKLDELETDYPKEVKAIRARISAIPESSAAAAEAPAETIRAGHGTRVMRRLTAAEAAEFAELRNSGRLALRPGIDKIQPDDQITRYGRFRMSPIAESPNATSAGAGTTWDKLDMVTKDLGAASKEKPIGPYKNLKSSGAANALREAAKLDQQAGANAISEGAGARFTEAQDAFKAHDALKKAYRQVLTNGAADSLAGKVVPAIGLLGNGVPEAFDKVMTLTPKKDRPFVALAGMYQFIKDGMDGNPTMDASKYIKFYEGLKRNDLSRRALESHLPEAFVKKMADVYEVTRAIYDTSRIPKGEFAHAFADSIPLKERLKMGASTIAKGLTFGAANLPQTFGFDVAGELFGKPTELQGVVRKMLTSPMAKEAMRRQASGAPISDGFVRTFMQSTPVRAFMAIAPELKHAPLAQRFDYMRNALGNTKFVESQPQEANQ